MDQNGEDPPTAKEKTNQSLIQKTLNRKNLLSGLLAGGAYLALKRFTGSLDETEISTIKPTSPTPAEEMAIPELVQTILENRPTPVQEISEPITTPEIPKTIEQLSNAELVNTIISLKPESPNLPGPRNILEYEYTKRVGLNFAGLRLGLTIISNRYCRDALIGNLGLIMEEGGESKMPKLLNKDQTEWAKYHKIEPVVLNLCLIQKDKARQAIKLLQQKKLINKSLPADIDPDELMISPGGLAELVKQETDNFSHIGTSSAFDNINPVAFPEAIPALEKWAEILTQEVIHPIYPQIKYDMFAIPGSSLGDTKINLSGGAIGLQFMPDNALEIYYLLKEVGVLFNPFDPFDSLIGAWVFLALQKNVFDKNGQAAIRSGYQKSLPQKIYYSLAKWNPFKAEIEAIQEADSDYRKKFR